MNGVRTRGNHPAGMRPNGNHSAGMRPNGIHSSGKYVKIYKFSPPTDGLGRSPSPIILIE